MPDWLYPYVCGAGEYARKRYRKTSAHWQSRVFRHPRLIVLALCLPILVVAVLERDRWWLLAFGVVGGALLGAYLAILESPPAHIENWRRGFEGERRTARALAPLRRCGFTLLHDLPDRQRRDGSAGNLDHIVVGPSGVFLLDSKWFGGHATLLGDTVRVQRPDDEEDCYDLRRLARSVRGCAVRLQEDLPASAGVRFIQPVVVFWNRFDAGLATAGGIVFVHGTQLTRWLQDQDATTSVQQVGQVAASIAEIRPSLKASHRLTSRTRPRGSTRPFANT